MAADITPTKQLAGFIAKFTPSVAKQARAAVKEMRSRLPSANVMVYDNYNGLAIGFVPNDRPSDAIFSIAVFPDHITLCFLQGAKLKDPKRRLNGGGNQVRHIRVPDLALLDDPDISALMKQALESARVPLHLEHKGKLMIKSASAKQRPRRP